MSRLMSQAGSRSTTIKKSLKVSEAQQARDGVAVVDLAEIELTAVEDAEIVLVETDKLN